MTQSPLRRRRPITSHAWCDYLAIVHCMAWHALASGRNLRAERTVERREAVFPARHGRQGGGAAREAHAEQEQQSAVPQMLSRHDGHERYLRTGGTGSRWGPWGDTVHHVGIRGQC